MVPLRGFHDVCSLGDVHFEHLWQPMEIDAQHSHYRKYTIGMVVVVRKFAQHWRIFSQFISCAYDFIFIHKIHQHGRNYSEQLVGVSHCDIVQQCLLAECNVFSVKPFFGRTSYTNGFIHAASSNTAQCEYHGDSVRIFKLRS